MGVNPAIENADLERRCKPSFWPIKILVHPGLLLCFNPTAKKPQKSLLPTHSGVNSPLMNKMQKQFSLTGVSLKKSKFLPVSIRRSRVIVWNAAVANGTSAENERI